MTQVFFSIFRCKLQFFQANLSALVFLPCNFFLHHGYIILNIVIIIVLKGIQAGRFSLARTFYHHYDETIDGANQARFAISTYVFFQLWYFICLYAFFCLFNFIFLEQTSPCLGGLNWSSLTTTLVADRIEVDLP